MFNVNQSQPFTDLKEFYLPALHHPVMVGKRKMFNLSVVLGSKEVQVKRSSKKIKHTSFSKVILGAVNRMKKIFQPDNLQLGVVFIKTPTHTNLTLEFELVNRNKFLIGNEEYLLSIIASYTYAKADKVTYYPVLYRQVCTNGAVAVLSTSFKETIPVDKILDIGCEWTRCNFETYKNQANNYWQWLSKSAASEDTLQAETEKLLESVLGVKQKRSKQTSRIADAPENGGRKNSASILSKYIAEMGSNRFAVYNTLTEFASHESDIELRNKYFMLIGKYLSKEMNKSLKTDRENWADGMDWDSIIRSVS